MKSLFRLAVIFRCVLALAFVFFAGVWPCGQGLTTDSALYAQEDEDFGDDEGFDEDEEAAEDEETDEDGEDGEDAEPEDAVKLDPFRQYSYGDVAVDEIVASNPQTLKELVKAASLLTSLSRFQYANEYYRLALEKKPTAEEVDALLMEYGRPFFVALSGNVRLAPDGNAFGKYVITELEKRYTENASLVDKLIVQLSDPDPVLRRVAIQELQSRRSVAIPAMMGALAAMDDPEDSGYAEIEEAVLRFGNVATPAFNAALDSDDEALKFIAVRLLTSQTGANNPAARAALYRAAALISEEDEAVREYALECLSVLTGKKVQEKDIANFIQIEIQKMHTLARILEAGHDEETVAVLWRWDGKESRLVSEPTTRLACHRLDSYRLAKAFWNLYPKNEFTRKHLFYATSESVLTFANFHSLAPLKTAALLETPEFEFVQETYTVEEVHGYLKECLADGAYDAATLAALYLGENGSAELLYSSESPILVNALSAPNRLLRFAALEAIMKLDPQQPFAGASRASETLAWFLLTTGQTRILIGDVSDTDGNILGGRFKSRFYDFDVATSAQELLTMALDSSDYSVIVIDMELLKVVPDMVLQQLRMDPRAADVPIVLLALSETTKEAQRLAGKVSKCVWFPRPTTDDDIDLLLTFVNRVPTSVNLSNDQRLAETKVCLTWAEKIFASHRGGRTPKQIYHVAPSAQSPQTTQSAGSGSSDVLLGDLSKKWNSRPVPEPGPEPAVVFDLSKLLRPVLKLAPNPRFLKYSLAILPHVGTPSGQEMCLFLADSGNYNQKTSVAAAVALKKNILQFGVLLTTTQVAELYDRYNGTSERDTKKLEVRGLILDALEAPLVPQEPEEPQVEETPEVEVAPEPEEVLEPEEELPIVEDDSEADLEAAGDLFDEG